ncbi:MAG: LacI family DNA-binding transcriptional regulator [Aliishimia sp.]
MDKLVPNDKSGIPMRATISAIAKLAGVGTATVDRVLNNRAHVGEATRQRVDQAKRAIESGTMLGARPRPWRLKVFLPGAAGPSTDLLAACLQEYGARGNASIECIFTKKLDPALLARKLHACVGQGVDAVAFQALDNPLVHDAVEALANLNIPALAIMSGLENPALIGFIGIDNRAAGRTAGYLMGRLTRRSGSVLVVTGGELYRVHEDREIGFRTCLRQDFAHIGETIVVNGLDDAEGNYQGVRHAFRQRDDIIGIYNVGGGHQGVARAIKDEDAVDDVVFIGHNLTSRTQSYLLDGTMDIVIHMNVRIVAEQTVEALVSYLENKPYKPSPILTGVITRENIIGATFA